MNSEISKIVNHLKEGKTILYPTDTVWGLGCDVFFENSVRKIYRIKNREDSKALILLVSNIEMLSKYVELDDNTIDYLNSDRPTTIIYSKIKNLPEYILASDGSVAIRIVKDQFCEKIINQFGKPIVSTSANISGEPTAQIFSEISETILSEVEYVVNWRQDDDVISEPSKIIKILENNQIQIIRQ